jgi:hypothetical protein
MNAGAVLSKLVQNRQQTQGALAGFRTRWVQAPSSTQAHHQALKARHLHVMHVGKETYMYMYMYNDVGKETRDNMEKLWSSTLKFPGLGTAKYQ